MAFFSKEEMSYCLGGSIFSMVGNTNHGRAKVVLVVLWAGGTKVFHGGIHYRIGVDGKV